MSSEYQLERLGKDKFAEVWRIMEMSFPVDERRNRKGQEQILENPYYKLYGCRKDGVVAAFFAVWEFEEFAFVEHFAVDERYRNGGIGAGMLQELLKTLDTQVVLEVELPQGELEQRRIHFYERNGFVLNSYDYMQPAMSEEGKAIPLLLMTCPAGVSVEQFTHIRDTLYREVYRVQ